MDFSDLLTVTDVEKKALQKLPSSTVGYYWSGADEERTLKENSRAFDDWLIIPRMLINVSKLDMTVNLFGSNLPLPFAFAPTAMHCLANHVGEKATVKAAGAKGALMILSTLSTTSLEDVALANGGKTPLWFQLYIYKDRNLTLQIIRRIEKAGYRAIVLTVDAPFFGRRLADCRSKFALPPNLKLANFEGLAQAEVTATKGSEKESGLFKYIMEQFDQTLSWKDIDWLRSVTNLPIIAKGILSGEDASLALRHGISGIIVSNHGGRQVDGVPSSIDALPDVVKAVRGRCPVMMDGGIRTGTDVLKALGIGADLVFIGRPVLFGLAVGGFDGLCHVVDILKGELARAMALSGCNDIRNIPHIIKRSSYNARL